jgi:hypothetical protein
MSLAGEGSHIPLLASVVAIARPGPVLELGVGEKSTPLLRAMCAVMKRGLVSADTSSEWAEKSGAVTLDSVPLNVEWSVVFIDTTAPPSRLDLLRSIRGHAEYIVIHDTDNQSGDLGGLLLELETFPHRYDYKRLTPWTTVVSDVSEFPR